MINYMSYLSVTVRLKDGKIEKAKLMLHSISIISLYATYADSILLKRRFMKAKEYNETFKNCKHFISVQED